MRGGEALGKNNIVASLDLGSSKICCMIGKITDSGDIDILGYGITASSGIKKGIVINVDLAVQSISKAVGQAEEMSGIKLSQVVIGLSGESIKLFDNRGVVAIPRSNGEITHQDVERALQASKIMAIPYDREIIDIIPREFIVDGCEGIKDPIGMVGTRLEVHACIITGIMTATYNIARCVEKAGLSIGAIVLKPLAAAEMLLTADEMDMGVILVDVGAGTTEVSVFEDGCISHYELIPVGGEFITNDIAIGLRLPYARAEEIKCSYACANRSIASDKIEIEIQSMGETNIRKITQKDLAAIVQPRIQEILSFVLKTINDFQLDPLPPAGIVLSGGGLIHIDGALSMARQMFNLPVRLGITDSFDKEQSFTVALGLLYYSVRNKIGLNENNAKERAAISFFERAKRIIREYF